MFIAGCSVRQLLSRNNRRATAWILGVGTPLPFLTVLLVAPHLSLGLLMGDANNEHALVLTLACVSTVTSVPVVTRIFQSLDILNTRFASIILGSALLEDLFLWSVLSVALAFAANSAVDMNLIVDLVINMTFVANALLVMPRVLSFLSNSPRNFVSRDYAVAWMAFVLCAYVAVAVTLGISLAFAALLAGFGLMHKETQSETSHLLPAVKSISATVGRVCIPIYFAVIGTQINLLTSFDPLLLSCFMGATSALVVAAVSLGAKLAGMKALDIVNIAVTQTHEVGLGSLWPVSPSRQA